MLSLVQPLAPMRMMDMMLSDTLRSDAHLSCAPRPRFGPRLTTTSRGEYEFSLQAPGVAASDVNIEAHDGPRITLRGATKLSGIVRRLDYTLRLPMDADAAEARAQAVDGLITVTIPKVATTGPMRIAVSAEAPSDDESEAGGCPYTRVTLVAAGIAPSDLDLTVEGTELRVHGKSKRTGAALEHAYKLPRNADTANATAAHVDGILTVTVPKKPKAERKRIEVNKSPAEEDAREEPNDKAKLANATETSVAAQPMDQADETVDDAVIV